MLAMQTNAETFRVATFKTDVTVPMGHALMGGGIPPAKEVVDPLEALGMVLLGPDDPIVWLAIDWCEIRNDAYTAWREALAEAADTTPDRVLIAAVHQHDTPVADFTAQKLLDEGGLEKSLCDVAFVKDCISRTAHALMVSIPNAKSVTHYGVGEAPVENLASNRRVVGEDGTPRYNRNSSAPDPKLRAAPVGLIDPLIRTLSFWNEDQPVAAMSTYAVHPMSYYGRGGVSADFVGHARRRMAEAHDGLHYLYFSGCSGDVVAGKHNDGSTGERPKLADHLLSGMQAAWTNTTRHPLQRVSLRTVPLDLPLRNTGAFTPEAQQHTLRNDSATIFQRNLAAMGLSWRSAREAGQGLTLAAVDLGEALYVLMPAESFVQYQIDAQTLAPTKTVLVAGYGESAPGYIPSPEAVKEGFIEDHSWCWVGEDSPRAMNAALRTLMRSAP
jgi:hypothetical protein